VMKAIMPELKTVKGAGGSESLISASELKRKRSAADEEDEVDDILSRLRRTRCISPAGPGAGPALAASAHPGGPGSDAAKAASDSAGADDLSTTSRSSPSPTPVKPRKAGRTTAAAVATPPAVAHALAITPIKTGIPPSKRIREVSSASVAMGEADVLLNLAATDDNMGGYTGGHFARAAIKLKKLIDPSKELIYRGGDVKGVAVDPWELWNNMQTSYPKLLKCQQLCDLFQTKRGQPPCPSHDLYHAYVECVGAEIIPTAGVVLDVLKRAASEAYLVAATGDQQLGSLKLVLTSRETQEESAEIHLGIYPNAEDLVKVQDEVVLHVGRLAMNVKWATGEELEGHFTMLQKFTLCLTGIPASAPCCELDVVTRPLAYSLDKLQSVAKAVTTDECMWKEPLASLPLGAESLKRMLVVYRSKEKEISFVTRLGEIEATINERVEEAKKGAIIPLVTVRQDITKMLEEATTDFAEQYGDRFARVTSAIEDVVNDFIKHEAALFTGAIDKVVELAPFPSPPVAKVIDGTDAILATFRTNTKSYAAKHQYNKLLSPAVAQAHSMELNARDHFLAALTQFIVHTWACGGIILNAKPTISMLYWLPPVNDTPPAPSPLGVCGTFHDSKVMQYLKDIRSNLQVSITKSIETAVNQSPSIALCAYTLDLCMHKGEVPTFPFTVPDAVEGKNPIQKYRNLCMSTAPMQRSLLKAVVEVFGTDLIDFVEENMTISLKLERPKESTELECVRVGSMALVSEIELAAHALAQCIYNLTEQPILDALASFHPLLNVAGNALQTLDEKARNLYDNYDNDDEAAEEDTATAHVRSLVTTLENACDDTFELLGSVIDGYLRSKADTLGKMMAIKREESTCIDVRSILDASDVSTIDAGFETKMRSLFKSKPAKEFTDLVADFADTEKSIDSLLATPFHPRLTDTKLKDVAAKRKEKLARDDEEDAPSVLPEAVLTNMADLVCIEQAFRVLKPSNGSRLTNISNVKEMLDQRQWTPSPKVTFILNAVTSFSMGSGPGAVVDAATDEAGASEALDEEAPAPAVAAEAPAKAPAGALVPAKAAGKKGAGRGRGRGRPRT